MLKMTLLITVIPTPAFQLFSVITLFYGVCGAVFDPQESRDRHNSTLVINSLYGDCEEETTPNRPVMCPAK